MVPFVAGEITTVSTMPFMHACVAPLAIPRVWHIARYRKDYYYGLRFLVLKSLALIALMARGQTLKLRFVSYPIRAVFELRLMLQNMMMAYC